MVQLLIVCDVLEDNVHDGVAGHLLQLVPVDAAAWVLYPETCSQEHS